MYKLIFFLGICVAFVLGSKLPVADKKVEKIVGCYYIVNLEIDQENTLKIDDINVSLCTHIFYSAVGLQANASVEMVDSYLDIEYSAIKRFNGLRKKNPHLKTLVSMIDSTDVSDREKSNVEVMSDPTLREKLVNNIVNFVKKNGFNGIDLTITDRPKRGGSPFIKENLVLFLKALREKFDEERLILSVTVDPSEATAKILYDIKGISAFVNFINLRTIEFHESSDAGKKYGVGHSSPMYPSSKENAEERRKNIDSVVKYWISQGAPPSELVLGIAFDGISYALANPKKIGRGAPFTMDEHLSGTTAYNAMCGLIKKFNHLYDKEQQVPYIYDKNQIIAYDDVESIKKKAEYIEKMHLGGAMVWTIDSDDFDGECGEKFPLLKTLNRVLRNKQ